MVNGRYVWLMSNRARVFLPDNTEEAVAMRRNSIMGDSDNKFKQSDKEKNRAELLKGIGGLKGAIADMGQWYEAILKSPNLVGSARTRLVEKMRKKGYGLMLEDKESEIIEVPASSIEVIPPLKKVVGGGDVDYGSGEIIDFIEFEENCGSERPVSVFSGFDYVGENKTEEGVMGKKLEEDIGKAKKLEEEVEDIDLDATEFERTLNGNGSSINKFLNVFNYFNNRGYLMADKRKVGERHSGIKDLTKKFLEDGKTAVKKGRLTPEFYGLVGNKINDYLVSTGIEAEKEKWASNEVSEAERILAGKNAKYWKMEDRMNALEKYISECDVKGRYNEVQALGDKFFSGESLRNAVAKGRIRTEKVADLRSRFDNYLRVQKSSEEYGVDDSNKNSGSENVYSLDEARAERAEINGASKYFGRTIEAANKLFARFGKAVGLI